MTARLNMLTREAPARSISEALEILKNTDEIPKNIVEVGCMRMPLHHAIHEFNVDCCLDGHSTLLLAMSGYRVYSCDINHQAVELTKNILASYGKTNATVMHEDGHKFLSEFREKSIGLLFLDAWDADLPDSALQHLEAFEIAFSKFAEHCLILIDDTDVVYNQNEKAFYASETGQEGKGALLIPEAVNRGFKLVFSGRQTLLQR